MYKFLQILVWPFYRMFHPIKVVGKKNIPKKSKAVLICNHHSNSDIFVLGTAIFRRQYFLAKKELFKKRGNARFLKKMGAIPIDRTSNDISAIKACLKVLKEGKLLTIFPEGTRNTTDEILLQIKSGAGLIALKAGAPIIPMWIEKKSKAFRRNKLIIGNPVSLDEFAGQKISSEVLDAVGEKLRQEMLKLKDM